MKILLPLVVWCLSHFTIVSKLQLFFCIFKCSSPNIPGSFGIKKLIYLHIYLIWLIVDQGQSVKPYNFDPSHSVQLVKRRSKRSNGDGGLKQPVELNLKWKKSVLLVKKITDTEFCGKSTGTDRSDLRPDRHLMSILNELTINFFLLDWSHRSILLRFDCPLTAPRLKRVFAFKSRMHRSMGCFACLLFASRNFQCRC